MRWCTPGIALQPALLVGGCLATPPAPAADSGGDALPYERTWVLVDDASPPGALYGPKMTYDPDRRQVLLYGGAPEMDPAGATDAMWAWDGVAWTNLCEPCGLGRRLQPGFTYDEKRQRAVLFGGYDEELSRLGDLWEWDGASWEPVSLPGAPSPRAGHWMTYDPAREEIVLFGGDAQVEGTTDQTFVYDGSSWTEADLAVAPSRRSDQIGSAAVDPESGRILVYGGFSGFSEPFDDLWAWDGEEWSVLCTSCTGAARFGGALAYDPPRRRTLIIAGIAGDDSGSSGTWEMSDVDRACEYAEPTGRASGGVAYDRHRDVLVYYGGYGVGCADAACPDTLELIPLEPGEAGTCND